MLLVEAALAAVVDDNGSEEGEAAADKAKEVDDADNKSSKVKRGGEKNMVKSTESCWRLCFAVKILPLDLDMIGRLLNAFLRTMGCALFPRSGKELF